MEDFNFGQDFFDTYQSLSDGMKLAWLIVPPAFLLRLIALIVRHRDDHGELQVYRHGLAREHPPTLALLETEPVSQREPRHKIIPLT